MKFVRVSHCVRPVLALSSEGSVLLVQTMHPDPLGISRQIRETQPNKTELLSNTHILTSSALPYGSVIKPRREVFLSVCVCLCMPMTSQPHKQTCRGGICWQLKNWASKELKLPHGTQAGEKEYLFNKSIPPHTQVQSHSVWIEGKYECIKLSRHDLNVKDSFVRSTDSFPESAFRAMAWNLFSVLSINLLQNTLKWQNHKYHDWIHL